MVLLTDNLRCRVAEACNTLPTLPSVAMRLVNLADAQCFDVEQLIEVVGQDPVLACRILRAVNSRYFSLRQKVASVRQAVTMLGMHAVKTLALGFTLHGAGDVQDRQAASKPDLASRRHLPYWRRTLYAATAARVIAQRALPGQVEDCSSAALLVDLPTLVLDELFGARYAALLEMAADENDARQIEQNVLGTNRVEVMALLAEEWRLPELLRVPIVNGHDPAKVEDPILRKIAEIVSLARQCAEVCAVSHGSSTTSGALARVRRSIMKLYDIPELAADGLLCEIGQRTQDLDHLFEWKLSTAEDYQQLLDRASALLLELSVEGFGEGETTVVNQRRTVRMQRDGRLLLMSHFNGALGQPTAADVRDLSSSGIGLSYHRAMDVGDQFVIELPRSPGDRDARLLLYTVVRCIPTDSAFDIGAELCGLFDPTRLTEPS